MTPVPMSPACRGFARLLPEAVASVRRGQAAPEHVRECPACAQRLALAVAFGRSLAKRPDPTPAAGGVTVLADELAGIHERATSAMESSSFGTRLGKELSRAVPAPEGPWPLQEVPGILEPQMRRPGTRVPAWIWQRLQADARSAARANSRRRSVAAAIAASLALLAVFGWRIGRSEGTTTDIEIVFVPVSELPVAMSPTAILRQGLSK